MNCTPCQGHFKKERHLIFGHFHLTSTLILYTVLWGVSTVLDTAPLMPWYSMKFIGF